MSKTRVSIMDLMSSLNYPTDTKGVCHGLALMAERARRCKEFYKYKDRQKFFNHLNHDDISKLGPLIKIAEDYRNEMVRIQKEAGANTSPEAIEKALIDSAKPDNEGKLFLPITRKIKIGTSEKDVKLTAKQALDLLEIKAFFEQVWAHFDPDAIKKFLGITGPALDQTLDTYEIEKLIYDAESKDNRTSPLPKPSCYPLFVSSEAGLENVYLKLFLKSVQEADALTSEHSESVGLVIGTPNHSIHLFYDKANESWQLTNHSELISCKSTDEVVQQLNTIYGNIAKNSNPASYMGPNNNYIPNLTIQLFSDKPSELLKQKLEDIVHVSLATICKNNNINNNDSHGYTPLDASVRAGRNDIVQTILDAKINIDNTNKDDALLTAISKGRLEIVETLLNANANANVSSKTGTALLEATQREHIGIIKALTKAGANGASTLMFEAAQKGNLELLKALLEAEVNPNIPYMRATPLFIAIQEGHVECVNALLSHNADPNIPFVISQSQLMQFGNQYGVSTQINEFIQDQGNQPFYNLKPFDIAKIMGHTDVMDSLQNRDVKQPSATHSEPAKQSSLSVKKLSELDHAISNFGSQLFSARVNEKIFQSKTEKLLEKKSLPSGKNVAADVELFKLNLLDSLISASRQPDFTIDSINSYRQLDALMTASLKILHSYNVGPLSKPDSHKIAMITLLTNTINRISQQTHVDPKVQANHLMETLQSIHVDTVNFENKSHNKPTFFSKSSKSAFLKSLDETLNHSQFHDLKQSSSNPNFKSKI